MTQFIFVHTPLEVRDVLTPLLDEWEVLLPGWCREIIVKWYDAPRDDDGALSIMVNYEYRRAELGVYPNFMSHPERRAQAVVHEFTHVLLEPFSNYATDVRNALLAEKPELKEWVREAQRYAEESAICDITYAIQKLSGQRWTDG